MRVLMAVLMMFMLGSAWAAENDAEFKRLNTVLAVLNQEQQALSQQLQLIQAMRQSNAQAMCNVQIMPPGASDYADWVAAQRSAALREQQFRDQTDELYSRWTELE